MPMAELSSDAVGRVVETIVSCLAQSAQIIQNASSAPKFSARNNALRRLLQNAAQQVHSAYAGYLDNPSPSTRMSPLMLTSTPTLNPFPETRSCGS